MRDLLLLSIVGGASVAALFRPWIGVILWTWVSVMNPHAQFGWAVATMPVGQIVAVATLVGLLITHQRQNPFVASPVWALLAFTLWTCITLPFSYYLDQSLPLWIRSMKIFLMVFVTLALITDRRKLDVFVAMIVFSIAFYGVKGGIFTLGTGGQYRIWGPGGFIEGNNEMALALVTTIPLIRYLQLETQKRWLRHGLSVAMLLCAIAVLGTYSRGALLAIIAMTLFLWIKSKRKVLGGVLLMVAAVVALSTMPDIWFERMDSIRTYQEDDSALGRLNAWSMAWNLALRNLFGGGFMIYTPDVFAIYSPDPSRVHAAHSIYFQVLGEHGFIGLLLFLLLFGLTWRKASVLVKLGAKHAEHAWAGNLGAMVQVSLVGYGVGGAFLSLAYFDLPYNLMAATVLALHFVSRKSSSVADTQLAAAPAAVPGSPQHRMPAPRSGG
jgi:putative inorganic carbon (HCO3(-)) transporter